jgi:hypothetical protein
MSDSSPDGGFPVGDDVLLVLTLREGDVAEVWRRGSPPPAAEARIAFTLRLTPDQAEQLDTLVLRLRRQLGRARLDKAAVLLALVQAADASDEVRAAALSQLRA